MAEPVAITAGAMRCSLGAGRATIGRALSAGHGAPVELTLDDFSGRGFPYFPLDGRPPGGDAQSRLLEALEACAAEALAGAGLEEAQRVRTGVFLGSSSFTIGAAEQQYRQRLAEADPLPLPGQRYGDLARHLSEKFALGGGEYTFSTACTSSANALLYAAQAVRAGRMPAALVVGVECFNRTTLLGFDSLQLLSRSGYRPFDRHRAGLVLGEGVGAVVVTAPELALVGEWQGVALLGGANGCDPQGLTCSSAESMARVMAQALADSATGPEQLALIKAHGTGSESNDAAEARAMQQLFGRNLPPLTTLKGSLGHTLGASGMLELAGLVTCLKAGAAPPTSGFAEADPDLDCRPLTEAIPFTAGRVMLNYFGFGGNNTSLIVEVN